MKKPTNNNFRSVRKLVRLKVEVTEKTCESIVIVRKATISWSYSGVNINHIMHSLVGNKKIGYKIASWNCRRGLLDQDGYPSDKVTDIELYLQKHKLHMFGIIESDLHGPRSRIKESIL